MSLLLLPDLGEGLHEARLTEWLCQPGESRSLGEPVLAVETAKAVVEIPAPCDLTLEEQLVDTGNLVGVGKPLFRYQEASGKSPLTGDAGSVVGTLATAANEGEDRPFWRGRERFSAADCLEAQRRSSRQASTRATEAIRPPVMADSPRPLAGARLLMCRQLSAAHRDVVQATVFDEVLLPKKYRPLLPRMIMAIGAACRAVPEANAWLRNEKLILHPQLHLGLAVDTPHGLLVPVLPDAGNLGLDELAAMIKTAVADVREQRLPPGAARGATLTLSSYGGLGGGHATPLVMPPQVMIVGVGAIRKEYVLSSKGKLRKQRRLPLSLSFDHRALTGGEVIRFLQALKSALTP